MLFLYKDFKVVLSNFTFLSAVTSANLMWVLYFIFITYAPFVYRKIRY